MALIMYGYVNKGEPLAKHIRYNHQRKDSFHLFSAKNFGHTFGLREYSKFIGFKDYIDLPIDVVDDLLEGYGAGQEELTKLREKAARDAARKTENSIPEKAAIKNANRG